MRIKKVLVSTVVASTLFSSTVFGANIGVANNTVNVREGSSTSSNIVTSLNIGDQVSIEGLTNDFYAISQNGTTNYVYSDFIDFKEADGIVTGEGVFIRTAPSMDAETSGILSHGTIVNVTGQTDDWYQLESNGSYSYINKDYIAGEYVSRVGDPVENVSTSSNAETTAVSSYYKVTASGGLNLRDSADNSGSVIGVIPNGFVVSGLETVNGFTKVNYNGQIGYASADFLSLTDKDTYVESISYSNNGSQITNWAQQFIGTPYSYGGTSLNSGVDCSGFVYSVFKENPYFNTTLNRTAAGQYLNGTHVSKSELQPGDLVFFDTSGSNNYDITHSGIYIGNGDFIHASSGSARSVTISNLNEGYYLPRYVGATRVIN